MLPELVRGTELGLITGSCGGCRLRFLLPALEPALKFELRLLAEFHLTLALFEGLAGLSDDCTSAC